MTGSVLVVEDETKIRDLIRSYLEREGMEVFTTSSGAEAITLAARVEPDLVVLDLGLPDVPGETVARELRARSDVPIVILTARSEETDRIAGLELGADDYLTKPFSPRELVLRVHAVLRRGRTAAGGDGTRSYGAGVLTIDEERRAVTVRGQAVELTPTEWGLLVALARNPGRVYSRYERQNRPRFRIAPGRSDVTAARTSAGVVEGGSTGMPSSSGLPARPRIASAAPTAAFAGRLNSSSARSVPVAGR